MKLNRILLLLALALVQLPLEARAAAYDGDTEYCGTPYPFWWRFDGPRSDILVRNWQITPDGDVFRISFTLINDGNVTFEGGMSFALTHVAVDPRGYENPAALAPPSNVRSLIGAESLVEGTLPTLRPGQRAEVVATAKGVSIGANHILTLIFRDGTQVQTEPQPSPWFWLRTLSPRATPGALVVQAFEMGAADSRLVGYKTSAVRIAIKNVGRIAVEAGTPIRVIHGHSGSAGGYWGPDDIIDPHDPGNPYASYFREEVFSGRLDQALNPGQVVEIGGAVNVPEDLVGLQQLTIAVGH